MKSSRINVVRTKKNTVETSNAYKDIGLDESLTIFLPIGIYIVAQEGNILFINKPVEDILGKDAIGKKCWNLYKDNKKKCYNCPLKDTIKAGDTSTIEVEDCLKGKTLLITHIGIEYQNKLAVMEIFQDITSCKKKEEEIKDVARFPSENPNPVLRVSGEGKVIFSNRACLVLINSWACEIGSKISDTLNSKTIKLVELEENNQTFLFYIVPIKDDNYVNMYGFDITLRKKAEKQIQEATDIKTKLTSIVSHKLRTSLSTIKEPISLILDGIVGTLSVKQRELLEMARDNLDRLVKLANEFLDFQKMELEKMRFEMKKNDINKLITELSNSERLLIKQRGLVLTLIWQQNLSKIIFDKDKIAQVILNLLNNAIKYRNEGEIRITT